MDSEENNKTLPEFPSWPIIFTLIQGLILLVMFGFALNHLRVDNQGSDAVLRARVEKLEFKVSSMEARLLSKMVVAGCSSWNDEMAQFCFNAEGQAYVCDPTGVWEWVPPLEEHEYKKCGSKYVTPCEIKRAPVFMPGTQIPLIQVEEGEL